MYKTRNRNLLMYTSAVVILGVGITYAAVPLYRMFCSATGFAGTPTFFPQQKYVDVLPGESSLAFYKARNESKKDVIGIATYNVTPDRVAPYFSKVECFCFEEQKLLAGEEVDMPLLFFIDKDIMDDPSCRGINDIVLSYTFFKARRNAQGHLEPDAEEDVVQKSLGFEGYEHSPRAETRKTEGRNAGS
ncbi:cytochrome oxidase assembly factor [Pisolithus albus]|nr:cytochrome oxidase assembly factor [Pisolithus albus]